MVMMLANEGLPYEVTDFIGFKCCPLLSFRSCTGNCNKCKGIAVSDHSANLFEPKPINGETSDGYHTFNELYHHRAVLFSVIVRNYPELCWKSKKHSEGDMYEGMFIVGINTPDGQASYHYDIEPYWDMFDCEELEFAPEWDGHTSDQAIERIGKLMPKEQTYRVIKSVHDALGSNYHLSYYPECGTKGV